MAYETTTELAQAVEFELGEPTGGTSTFRSRIVTELDRAHKVICAGGGELNVDASDRPIRRPVIFGWARSATPKILNLEVPYDTGTVSVTTGSTAITLSASVTADKVGWYLRITGEPEVYRINVHGGSSASMTLDGAFVGSTAAAASYTIFKLDYTLGSDDILILTQELHAFKGDTRIEIIPLETLYKSYPLRSVSKGFPRKASILKQTNGTLLLRMSSYAEELERINCYYVPKPALLDTSSSNPLIPPHHRKVLVHLVAFYLTRGKDDDRSKSHFGSARQLFESLVTENYQMDFGNDDRFFHIDPDGELASNNLFKVEY